MQNRRIESWGLDLRRRVWPMLAMWIWMSATVASAGEGTSSPASPSRPGLVVKLPGTTVEALERALQPQSAAVSPDAAASRVVMAASDARILEPLREMLVPALRTGDTSGLRLCHPSGPRFSELLQQGANALEFFDLEDARLALSRAQKAFTCGVEVASRENLGRLVLLSGILQVYQGRDDDGRFEDALSVAPTLPLPFQYSEEVKKLFNRARKQQSRLARVSIQRWKGDMADLKLLLDGTEFTDTEVSLPVGTHFLQLVKPDGQALAGVVAALEPATGDEPLVWPPPQLRPPCAEEVLGMLGSDMHEGRPSPPMVAALENLRQLGDYAWVLLIDFDVRTRLTRTTWLFPDGLIETRAIEPPSAYAGSREQLLAAGQDAAETGVAPGSVADGGTTVSKQEMRHMLPVEDDEGVQQTHTPQAKSAGGEALSTNKRSSSFSSEELVHYRHQRRKKRLGVVATSGFAAAALVSGYFYRDAYERLNSEVFATQEAADEVRRRGNISGAAAAGCLAGAVVSAGITLMIPSGRPGVAEAGGMNPHLSLLAGASAVELRLGGAW